ncbi:sensor histidine kinase [Neptuniibacter sp. CAU 1671]|uniref:sensor histidine kinase n=1 Tax=Neptuniibacter sp. CAU 1671 TaxID=3032593 RepID=UPI0031F3A52E
MFSRLKIKTRMILILGLMALLQTGLIGWFAVVYLQQSLDEQMGQRALHVARTIAAMPEIRRAVEQRDSAFLYPLTQALAKTTEARFVVIGDQHGVRLAHPVASKIGGSMSDDDTDDNDRVLKQGQGYITKDLGSLGWSMRGKAPIFAAEGRAVIGIVSVGYDLSRVEQVISRYQLTLLAVIFLSFLLSALTAIWFAYHFKKAIFGLEPEQIALRFREQEATLQTVREGIIAINAQGRITTFNAAAVKTLGLDENTRLSGRKIEDVLPGSAMLDVLNSGEPQYDLEVWRDDHNLIVNRLPLQQDGKITGVVSSFRRKDELDLVSEKLTRIEQYADSLRSQSHEYSNKLHTIAGLIQLGAHGEALALIGQETHSHQALIHLLVEAVTDPILAACLLGKYNRAREMGLTLEIDPESQMHELPAHLPKQQLVSIIGNLIDNALEATLKSRGAGGEVYLSMTDLGNDLIFEIEDQGPGLSEAEQAQIFLKGVSTKAEKGHGLGLHLVQNLLTNLGGTVTVESADSGGSRFIVYIPKHKEAE